MADIPLAEAAMGTSTKEVAMGRCRFFPQRTSSSKVQWSVHFTRSHIA